MIYFLRDTGTGLIKIGYTRHAVADRLRNLQAGNPLPLSLLLTVPGNRARERRYHRQLAADRMGGEWFQPSPALTALVGRLIRRGAKVEAVGHLWYLHQVNPQAAANWQRWLSNEPWRCRMLLALARHYEDE